MMTCTELYLELGLCQTYIAHFEKIIGNHLSFETSPRGKHLRADFTIEPTEPLYLGLNRWYSPSRGDHITTTHRLYSPARTGRKISPDYEPRRFEGFVFNPALPQPEGTVPLFSWWNPRRGDNFLTTDERWRGDIGDWKDLPPLQIGRLHLPCQYQTASSNATVVQLVESNGV